MKLAPPQYNGKDNLVMAVIVPSGGIVLNILYFGADYIAGPSFFGLTTLISIFGLGLLFILCGAVAVAFKNRFPSERDLVFRLTFVIVVFLVLSGLFLYGLFQLYTLLPFIRYPFNETGFIWCYFTLGIINIFLTFLMEGLARFHEWEKSRLETEKLNKAYTKCRLDGLKSQVNPHFLFNSLNTLSSLIQDDEVKAERFLDEMSKVYRYMLRDENQWVDLCTELKFVQSYMHLLKARFGEAIQLSVEIPESMLEKLVAPLALQVIIENAFTQNITNKERPLHLRIYAPEENVLVVGHNLQPKALSEAADPESGLDHLINKYRLSGLAVEIDESVEGFRSIALPLIVQHEDVLI